MNPASLDQLLKIIPNKYLLTMVIAQRAKQIEQGAERHVESDSKNSIDIAIREIAEEKFDVADIIAKVHQTLTQQVEEDSQIETEDMGVGVYLDYDGEGEKAVEAGDDE